MAAGGSGVVIPLTILDNSGTESLRQLTLHLNAGDYAIDPAAAASTLTIRENDNYWRGAFVSENGLLDLEIYLRRDASGLTAFLTDGTELLPDDGLSFATDVSLDATTFHADFPPTDILSTPENLVAPGTRMALVLDADNATPDQAVSTTELTGTATMTLSNATKPHLDTSVSGTFTVRQDPELQPTDDLTLE